MSQAVFNLRGEKEAFDKMVAEFLMRVADALNFDDIDADTKNHPFGGESSISPSISRTAGPRPTVTARLTMLWPMLSSLR